LALARADLVIELNDPAAAERSYRRAERLYREARSPAGMAEARQGLASLLLDRGDLDVAGALLQSALQSQQTAGLSAPRHSPEFSWENSQHNGGDTTLARQQLARAESELRRLGDPVATATALGERATLEASAGLPTVAASLYQSGLDLLSDRDRPAPAVAWQLHAGLGRAWKAQGLTDRAARELRNALSDLEGPTASMASSAGRAGFLADKWNVYTDLARIEHARKRPGAAFELSESLRAREMLELLEQGRVRSPPEVPADLVEREQDLRRRIAELSVSDGELRTVSLRGSDPASGGPGTREALLQAQQAYGEVLQEIRERAPRHGALLMNHVVAWRDVARRLEPDQALIEYLVSDSGAMVFIVTADTLVTLDLHISRGELVQLVEFVRGVFEPMRGPGLIRYGGRRSAGCIGTSSLPSKRLACSRGSGGSVLVPHAELHYLPFAALMEDAGPDRFLIQRYELLEAPSASVWLALEAKRNSAPNRLLAFAPREDALPGSRREVETIVRRAGPSGLAVMGEAATEDLFRQQAPSGRVLHLATFGILNKHNPLFSYVELASGGGHDGRLEVHEIFGLSLTADLVVLSACQTVSVRDPSQTYRLVTIGLD
jgi:tetratricopeptide (TPR) repeat protein